MKRLLPLLAASLCMAWGASCAAAAPQIPPRALDAMTHWAQLQQRRITPAALRDELIEQRLLGDWARAHHGAAELYPAAHVGFAPDVVVEDRLVAMLRALYRERLEASIAALPGGRLDALVVDAAPPPADELERVFDTGGKLLLDADLDAAQRALAEQIVVLRYRLAPHGAVQTATLATLYRRQNAQGRLALHARDLEHLHAAALEYLAGRYVLARVTDWEGAPVVAALRAQVEAEEAVRGLAHWYGLGADAHADVAHVAALAAAVTRADIAQYYAAHRDEFRRIDAVYARHVRVADEAAANAVYAAATQPGADFAALARSRSIAPDARSGGDLGRIARDHAPDWLADLAYTQAPGVSRPTRAPGEPEAWEVVRVERRETSFHAADSETVAWAARRAIAAARAAEEFRTLRRRLRREAGLPPPTQESA